MKARFDKLVIVRGAASRLAASTYAEASSRVAAHENMAGRLDDAAATLAPEPGAATGSGLTARMELGDRMRTARRAAQSQVDAATVDRGEAGHARKAARRALDAAIDVRRNERKAVTIRREARIVPIIGKRST